MGEFVAVVVFGFIRSIYFTLFEPTVVFSYVVLETFAEKTCIPSFGQTQNRFC